MSRRLEMAASILRDATGKLPGNEVARISRKIWDLPMQVCLSEKQFNQYLAEAVTRLGGTTMGVATMQKSSNKIEALVDGFKDDRDMFPLKEHSAASTKVNVFMSDTLKDYREHWGREAAIKAVSLIYNRVRLEGRPVYNDEATAWLIWIHCAQLNNRQWVSLLGLNYEGLKTLSDEIKGMGVTCNHGANIYVEMVSLKGRAVGAVDVQKELEKRCEATKTVGMLAPFSTRQIREAVRRVVAEERGSFRPPTSYEEAFIQRFATTKAGSHHAAEWDPTCKLPNTQMTRRNYVEELAHDTLHRVKPGGYVSFSEKLECGKTRAIYSLDSDNYLRFDAPARALEET